MAPVESALVKKLGSFIRLSPAELALLAEIQSNQRPIPRHTELVHEGQSGHRAFILQEGWASCYKMLPDGGRQIITFSLPGDCMGLRSVLLRTSDHSFAAVTDAVVSDVPAHRMISLFHDHPRLGAAILWAASRDEAMTVEHLVNIGRRSAIDGMAHLILELWERLRLVGMATPAGFDCPLNQNALADALGLSVIHVNRVLRQLRERGLMTFVTHQVVIHDLAALRALAQYDSGYLDQSGAIYPDGQHR
jgi:CRP-like cAMP-binding protein